jgi:hypothetical protein
VGIELTSILFSEGEKYYINILFLTWKININLKKEIVNTVFSRHFDGFAYESRLLYLQINYH